MSNDESEMLKLVSSNPGNKSATAILQRREEMRSANKGLLLPLPSAEVRAKAKMVDPLPGETLSKPNAELQEMFDHFTAVHDHCGSPEDIMRSFTAWNSPHPMKQATLQGRDLVDRLIAKARPRERVLQRMSEAELKPQRDVDKYRSNVQAASERVKKAEAAERSEARNELARLRSELDRAEANLKQQGA